IEQALGAKSAPCLVKLVQPQSRKVAEHCLKTTQKGPEYTLASERVGAPQSTVTGANNRLSRWLGMLGILLLFIGLRWDSYDAPLIRDEGEFAYAAQLL